MQAELWIHRGEILDEYFSTTEGRNWHLRWVKPNRTRALAEKVCKQRARLENGRIPPNFYLTPA